MTPCGNSMAGNSLWSLSFTHLFSGRTENRAIWNKGAEGVLTRVKELEKVLPFPLKGFNCDNGSEFLNHLLRGYLEDRKHPVAFTRTRPLTKNDNAHVEQKHWTHVRHLFGYSRFEEPLMVEAMNDLYEYEWSLLQIFFCPSFKLESKERIISKYRRRYETPKTPFQRLMESPHISQKTKRGLKQQFRTLNPFHIKAALETNLETIFNLFHTAPDWGDAPLPIDRNLW